MLKILHITDLHLPFVPRINLRQALSKSGLGYISWKKRRQYIYLPEVLECLTQAIKAYDPHYILLTGDIVNLGLPEEFTHAHQWLHQLAPPEKIIFVPGNHDRYVPYPIHDTLGQLGPYYNAHLCEGNYPFSVDISEHVSVVGLNTGLPTAALVARGAIGDTQYKKALRLVNRLKQASKFIVFMIHHPPLMHQNSWPRGLPNADYSRLHELITVGGSCIVVHGHNHDNTQECLSHPHGNSFVFGTASGSSTIGGSKPASSFRCLEFFPDTTTPHILSHVIQRLCVFNGETYQTITDEQLQLFS